MVVSSNVIIIAIIIAVVVLLLAFLLGKKIGSALSDRNWHKKLPSIRKDIANSSRSIIKGQVSEQLAPYLPNFPFDPVECKFIGNPVDFLVFQDLDKDNGSKIIFVEVKTGQSGLNAHERNVKAAIENNRVYWYEYRL